MKRLLFALLLPAFAFAQQAQPDPTLVRMRDAMRKLTQRITDAESQMVAAQSAQAGAEEKANDLDTKLNAANKQIKELNAEKASDKAAADKKIADLEAKLAASEKDNATLTDSLGKWKAGYAELQSAAKAVDARRATAESQVVQLQRRVEDREAKNRELHKLGTEILDRYKNFGLGTALAAREPFTGITKVKLQTLVQDYADKLDDNTVRAGKP